MDSYTMGIVDVTVTVVDETENLGDHTNESYALKLGADGKGEIHAQTVFGAMHGLESLSQLVEVCSPGAEASLRVRGLPWDIMDSPRFGHRGTLLDTSRHFQPLSSLRAHIDAMSYSKLNLLHWHIVDFQSFPLISDAVPSLHKGAYSAAESYSLSEISNIVAYGKARGVRVMVELDTPGHTGSWVVGEPDIMTDCLTVVDPHHPSQGWNQATLDPSQNRTFKVVEALVEELASVFPDSAFHLGGDEVHFACWNASARVREFMASKGMLTPAGKPDFAQLEQYYENSLMEIASRVLPTRKVMVYQEVFDNNVTLPSKVVFGVWKKSTGSPLNRRIPEEVVAIAQAGHEVVLMNGNQGEWYLNDGQ
jgi:hexosaminidase